MFNRHSYERDYDDSSRHREGNWFTRAVGVGMGYSGGAGEAKKGETSERIGDYSDSRYYGSSGFGSNYGTGTNYSYGYPLESTGRYNTTATNLSTYPTHYDRQYHTGYIHDANRYDRNYNNYYDNNRYSGYSNLSRDFPHNQYYGSQSNPTGYRTVTETREIVRDSDRPYGHSNVYTSGHYNRDNDYAGVRYNSRDSDYAGVRYNNRDSDYGSTGRHWNSSYNRY